MYICDDLRIKISQKHSINLEQYVWSDDLNKRIMDIELSNYEEFVYLMSQVYGLGLNIGQCGITSTYLARIFPKSEFVNGILPLLKGTKNSKDGNHAWIINDGYLLDPTLRLILPLEVANKLGYKAKEKLSYRSARKITRLDLYSPYVFERLENVAKFNEELLQI